MLPFVRQTPGVPFVAQIPSVYRMLPFARQMDPPEQPTDLFPGLSVWQSQVGVEARGVRHDVQRPEAREAAGK